MPTSEVVYHYEEHGDVASDVDDHDVRNTHRESGLALEVLPFRRHPIDAVYLTLMSAQNQKYFKVSGKGHQETEE